MKPRLLKVHENSETSACIRLATCLVWGGLEIHVDCGNLRFKSLVWFRAVLNFLTFSAFLENWIASCVGREREYPIPLVPRRNYIFSKLVGWSRFPALMSFFWSQIKKLPQNFLSSGHVFGLIVICMLAIIQEKHFILTIPGICFTST